MKKIVAIILLSAGIISAQSATSSGLSSMKFGFGARNIAMGDLGVVTANDVSALNYNPALLTKNPNAEISFTHNSSVQDLRSEMLGAKFRFLGLPMAVGLNTTSVDDIEVRTRPGDAESKFNANFFWGSLSTGFHLTKNISAGLSVKYIYEGLFTEEAMGIGFNFGAYYEDVIPNLGLGISVRNIGSMNKLRTESTKLPSELNTGIKYYFALDNFNSNLIIAAGYKKYLEDEFDHFSGGIEWIFRDMIALRTGYISGFDTKSITAGLGLMWNGFVFDYAYVPYEFDFGSSNTISIKYIF